MGTKPMEWYAVYTRSRFEKKVHEDLSGQGIETFLPLYSQKSQRKNTTVIVKRPLFTSYLFVNTSPKSQQWFKVLDSRGVVTVLGSKNGPTVIPEREITMIRQVLSSKFPVTSSPWLQKGKRVRVVAGPLCGIEGVVEEYKRYDRLFIEIESLGQSIVVDVDASDVEIV